MLYRLGCPQDPGKYLAQLDQAAAAANAIAAAAAPPGGQFANRQTQPPRAAAAGSPYRPVATGPAAVAAAGPVADPAGMSVYSQSNYAAYLNRDAAANPSALSIAPTPAATAPAATVAAAPNPPQPPASHAVAANAPPSSYAAAPRGAAVHPQFVVGRPAIPPAAPPLGLDGFCPVTLVERSNTAPDDPRCWVRGDPRWGVVHRGITYLFLGPGEQKRFLTNPDRFAPALSGNDAVLAFDKGQLVRGRREFGIFFDKRMYLFANGETLERFQHNPRRYAAEVRQAENPPHAAVR